MKPPAFRDEVDALVKQDKLNPPRQNSILFVGSSSITQWTSIQDSFPTHPIILRGIDGASLPDLVRYADEIIFPYHPKQIFIYCGDNDIAYNRRMTAEKVLSRFEELFTLIRTKLPNVPIGFISIKPSPSRWNFEPMILESNQLIKNYLEKQPKTFFVNIHTAMLDSTGKVNSALFIADQLHLNANGYAIWKKAIEPYLIAE